MVVKGFEQQINSLEISSQVARTEAIKLLMGVATQRNLTIVQFDVASAFLKGELNDVVFVDEPEGIKIRNNECLKLKKAL